MGVIRKQAGYQSLFNYLGTAIGAVAVLWIYPLELEAYGLAQFLVGTGQFLIPFASLGLITLVVRFYPEFKSSEWRESYLASMLILMTGAMLLVCSFVAVFGNVFQEILRKLAFRDEFLYNYFLRLIF